MLMRLGLPNGYDLLLRCCNSAPRARDESALGRFETTTRMFSKRMDMNGNFTYYDI